jgi:hypothetical protein
MLTVRAVNGRHVWAHLRRSLGLTVLLANPHRVIDLSGAAAAQARWSCRTEGRLRCQLVRMSVRSDASGLTFSTLVGSFERRSRRRVQGGGTNCNNTSRREDATDIGRCPRERCPWIGATMRFVLALGLLVSLCAFANAAMVHRSQPRHVVRTNQGLTFGHTVSGWPYEPPGPVFYDDAPRYDDPSKFGANRQG